MKEFNNGDGRLE